MRHVDPTLQVIVAATVIAFLYAAGIIAYNRVKGWRNRRHFRQGNE